MKRDQLRKLREMCAKWREEIQRLEGELEIARKRDEAISITTLVVAIDIRERAVCGIEAIVGSQVVVDKLDVIIGATKERARLREELAGTEPRPLLLRRDASGPILISRDPSEKGRWRATAFKNNHETIGHITSDTFAEAVRDACDLGANPGDPIEASRLLLHGGS